MDEFLHVSEGGMTYLFCDIILMLRVFCVVEVSNDISLYSFPDSCCAHVEQKRKSHVEQKRKSLLDFDVRYEHKL